MTILDLRVLDSPLIIGDFTELYNYVSAKNDKSEQEPLGWSGRKQGSQSQHKGAVSQAKKGGMYIIYIMQCEFCSVKLTAIIY